jgi:hypothetical protein
MRILLQFVLPIVLPGLLFLLWTYLTQARSQNGGTARTLIAEGPWFRLILAGFVLMAAGLAAAAIFGGMDPDGTYQAPYQENGEIVPGGMVKKP